MKKINKFGLIFILIAAMVISGALLLKKRKQSIKNALVPIVMAHTVDVVLPVNRQLKQTRSFLAKLVATDIAKISTKFTGRINEISVQENQPVKKGAILAKIDDREIAQSLKALISTQKAQEIELEYIQNLYLKNQTLMNAGGLAKEKLDESEVQYLNKKAALENIRQKILAVKAQLSYLTLKAPFDGIVGTIYLQKGSLATPGQPVLTLNAYEQKLIFNYVPETTGISIGKDVMKNDKTIGKISKLCSDADNGLQVAEVTIEHHIDKPNGSYLHLNVVIFEGSGCTVPINALLHQKNKTEIMIYENKQFKPLTVTIIAQDKQFAMIEPCPSIPVAVGAESKLGQLTIYKKISVQQGVKDE
jgi:RND family efflux transporter MFP subunit